MAASKSADSEDGALLKDRDFNGFQTTLTLSVPPSGTIYYESQNSTTINPGSLTVLISLSTTLSDNFYLNTIAITGTGPKDQDSYSIPAGVSLAIPGSIVSQLNSAVEAMITASSASNSSTGSTQSKSNSPTPTDQSKPLSSSTSAGSTSLSSPTSVGSSSQPSISKASTPFTAIRHGISSSATAGIGIGAFVIGVFLALGAAFLCMRYRGNNIRRGNYRSPRSSGSGGIVELQESVFSKEKPGPRATCSPTIPLEQILLEPVSDPDTRQNMQVVCTQIEQHVANNYHQIPENYSSTRIVEVMNRSGYNNTGVSAEDFTTLLGDPRSRPAAIIHAIAWIIFTRVSDSSKADVSLLPIAIAQLLQAIPPAEASSVNQNGKSQASAHDPRCLKLIFVVLLGFNTVFSKWRSETAFLLQPLRSNRTPLRPNETELQPSIDRNMALLDEIVQPFISPGPSAKEQQGKNLRAIMFEAAKFGLILFSQPTSWAFDWKTGRKGSNTTTNAQPRSSLVVFPALVKSSNVNGKHLPGGDVVVEAEIMSW